MSARARAFHTVWYCVRTRRLSGQSSSAHSLVHLLTLILLLSWSLTPFDLNFSSSRVKTCVALNIRAQQSQLSLSLSLSLTQSVTLMIHFSLIKHVVDFFFSFPSISLALSLSLSLPALTLIHSLLFSISISFTFNFRCYDSSTNKPILFSDCCFLLLFHVLLFSDNLACINVISTNFGRIQIRIHRTSM